MGLSSNNTFAHVDIESNKDLNATARAIEKKDIGEPLPLANQLISRPNLIIRGSYVDKVSHWVRKDGAQADVSNGYCWVGWIFYGYIVSRVKTLALLM